MNILKSHLHHFAFFPEETMTFKNVFARAKNIKDDNVLRGLSIGMVGGSIAVLLIQTICYCIIGWGFRLLAHVVVSLVVFHCSRVWKIVKWIIIWRQKWWPNTNIGISFQSTIWKPSQNDAMDHPKVRNDLTQHHYNYCYASIEVPFRRCKANWHNKKVWKTGYAGIWYMVYILLVTAYAW